MKTFENSLRQLCEESVCGMDGSKDVLGGGEWDAWNYVLKNQLL